MSCVRRARKYTHTTAAFSTRRRRFGVACDVHTQLGEHPMIYKSVIV